MTDSGLEGLISAVHTPLSADGSLCVERVERQAEHLLADGVRGVFVGGTTGEGHSLTALERMALAERWSEVARGTPLQVIVHVGHDSLQDAASLARHAAGLGIRAIGARPTSFVRPQTVPELVEQCGQIAACAPELPFYYYDIPALSGVDLPMSEFLEVGHERIPTLTGIKYTNPNLPGLQRCIAWREGAADILFGVDEALLAGLALGAKGAVGSTYNFAAPLYLRLIASFERGDHEDARREQLRSVQLIDTIASFGFGGAAKAVMSLIGVDCGPARLPWKTLSAERVRELESALREIGFFDWGVRGSTQG